MTQWYDILGVIGVIFAGFSAMLVLVVYLEQWLAGPDSPTPASADEQALKPDRKWGERWAPDLSVQTGASYLSRALAPSLCLDPPAARVSEHLLAVLPPNAGQQCPLTWRWMSRTGFDGDHQTRKDYNACPHRGSTPRNCDSALSG